MSEQNDKQTFSRFGTDFQEKLCLICLQEREFFDQFSEVLDYNFFEVKYLQHILKQLYEHREKYRVHPTIENLTIAISEIYRKNDSQKSLNQAVEFLEKNKETVVKDVPFIKDTALEFCKKQVLKEALSKSLDLWSKSSFDEIKSVVDEACKKGLTRDFGHDYVRDIETRFGDDRRIVIPTPWPEINDLTGGGFGRGDLNIFIAPTGIGKSHLLVDFGAEAASMGYKGVHYTLELSARQTGIRYDARLSKVDVNLRRAAKEEIYRTVSELKGNIIIREWPTKSASVLSIRNHLDKIIQKDFVPDFVNVDYADLLKSVSKSTEKRHQLEEINEELRGIAKEYNVAMVSCSQTNRCLGTKEKVNILGKGNIEIGNVEKGQQILTHLGYKKIINVFPKEKQPVYEITTKSGKKIRCSIRHEFPTQTKDGIELKSILSGLTEGDKLFVKK